MTEQDNADYEYIFPEIYRDHKHWARPLKRTKGVTSEKFLYIGVGHALTNWEYVECAMAILFGIFVDSHSTAASRAYGSISGSHGRAHALQEAGNVFFAVRRAGSDQREREFIKQVDLFKEYFDALLNNYRLASARRNDIAHGMTFEFSPNIDVKEKSWLLIPPMYQSSHRGDVWTRDDIKLNKAKGLKMSDAEARPNFMKMALKNCEYTYNVDDLKTMAGKFAHFDKDIMLFIKIFRPQQVPFTPEQYLDVAQRKSQ